VLLTKLQMTKPFKKQAGCSKMIKDLQIQTTQQLGLSLLLICKFRLNSLELESQEIECPSPRSTWHSRTTREEQTLLILYYINSSISKSLIRHMGEQGGQRSRIHRWSQCGRIMSKIIWLFRILGGAWMWCRDMRRLHRFWEALQVYQIIIRVNRLRGKRIWLRTTYLMRSIRIFQAILDNCTQPRKFSPQNSNLEFPPWKSKSNLSPLPSLLPPQNLLLELHLKQLKIP